MKLLKNQGNTSPTGSSCYFEEFARLLAYINHSNSSTQVAGQMTWNALMTILLTSETDNA